MRAHWIGIGLVVLSVGLTDPPLRAAPIADGAVRRLSYALLEEEDRALANDLDRALANRATASDLRRRRIPEVIPTVAWGAPDLVLRSVPLPEVDTLGPWLSGPRRIGRLEKADGTMAHFIPQVVLVKFRPAGHVTALRVEAEREWEAVQALAVRADVEFAELDILQRRQFTPNDTELGRQWHHAVIGSFGAWDVTRGDSALRIAVVDTPFQMDHPDLAANTVDGWSTITGLPVTESAGIDHSTAGAGMAAAVLNNGLGVAGAANCRLLPIDLVGSIDEMYAAIIWAADHGVRVVNISWSGGDSSSLNEAGRYLETQARGVLAMSGVNGIGFLNYTNQPHVYCISMTDAADNLQSYYGNHIDFAAPGYQVFTALTGSRYGTVSGTSYSTPLFCGVVAALFSINPTLSPAEAIDLLKSAADDLGPTGWDPYFGWGRVNFDRAAQAARDSLPRILSVSRTEARVTLTVSFRSGPQYSLWKTTPLTPTTWSHVVDARAVTNGTELTLTDLEADGTDAFYRVGVQ